MISRPAEFLQEMEAFVRREKVAQQTHFQQLWAPPVAERVENGHCIADLEFLGNHLREGHKFICRSINISDFREGDLVRLSRGEPVLSTLDAEILRIDNESVWLSPSQEGNVFPADLSVGRWVLDRSYLDLSSHQLRALALLGTTARGRERILPLLLDEISPTLDGATIDEVEKTLENEETNDSQAEAVIHGVATDLCHLIQGPPGTGKTHVLAKIVRERLARGERILISGPTHRAIHQALNTIRRLIPDLQQIVKIGRHVFDEDLQVAQYESFQESPLADCDGGYVVGATAYTARSNRRLAAEFDTVIIDEASQMTVPLAAMAMLSGDCYLLIGDHRQLPPVVQSERPLEAAKASIFQLLQGRDYQTLLTRTYRMNTSLTLWPSENFYHGALLAAESNAARRLALPQPVQDFAEVLDPAHPLVLLELQHATCRRQSNEEASTVAGILDHLHRAGVELKNVAVVVPFRRQARRIRYFLGARRSLDPSDWQGCTIDTVERMQGQEREVVLLSMTASSPDYLRESVEFLLLPHRLNVAVTRARSKVIVLASHEIARLETADPAHQELVQLWRTLRKSARRIPI